MVCLYSTVKMMTRDLLIKYLKNSGLKKLGFKNTEKITIKDLPKGMWSSNFVITIDSKKFVIKTYMSSQKGIFVNSSRKEFEAMKVIEKIGIAPKPLLLDESKETIPYEIMIQEYIDGTPIKDLNEDNIKKVAVLLSKLHSIKIKDISKLEKKDYRIETLLNVAQYMVDSCSKQDYVKDDLLSKFKKILDKIKKKLTPLPKFEEKESIIHTDMIAGNILVLKNGDIKLVDWQACGFGDPAFDVWAFTNKAFNLWDLDVFMNDKQKKIFINEYLKNREDKDLVNRIEAKKYLWILILSIYSLMQYEEFKLGHVDKTLMDRKEKFIKYEEAYERGFQELKENLLS
mgnify:CR=1 FL=1